MLFNDAYLLLILFNTYVFNGDDHW